MTDAIEMQDPQRLREPGPAERKKLADLFAAIGNASNATIKEMPEFSDDRVRRQIMHTFAAVGGFVMYSDILEHSSSPSESTDAIVLLGRALSRRLEVKE